LAALISCVSSQNESYLQQGETALNGFKNIVIYPLIYNGNQRDINGVENRIRNSFISERKINVITQESLNDMKEFVNTLFCSIAHESDFWGTHVTLSYMDYKGELIYRTKGYSALSGSLGWREGLKQASRSAVKEFFKVYTGYNSSFAIRPEEIYADWEKVSITEEEAREYFDNNIELDPIEGFWHSNQINNRYKIAIIKDDNTRSRDYLGFIIESDNSFWTVGQVKLELNKTAHSGVYSINYYMGDHSKVTTDGYFPSEGLLEINLKNMLNKGLDNAVFIKDYPRIASTQNSEEISVNRTVGSGVSLNKNGIFVTNYHVVKDATNLSIIFPEENLEYKAEVLIKDVNNDIAILKINDFNINLIGLIDFEYGLLTSDKVKVGESCFTLGFPFGDILGEKVKFSTGNVSSKSGILDNPVLYQISNPIQPGNSGGPLFDKKGNLIGIIVSTLDSQLFLNVLNHVPQNVNFAIKIDYIINLINMLPDNFIFTERTNDIEKETTALVDFFVPYVVKVIGEK
jgi:S1-C subfamily serine protease